MADHPPLHHPDLGPDGQPCAACAAPLAADQRYCLACGHRRADPRLDWQEMLGAGTGAAAAGAPAPPAAEAAVAAGTADGLLPLPSPRTALALGAVLLAVGTVLGGVVGPRVTNSDAAGQGPLIVLASPPVAPAPAKTPPPEPDTVTDVPSDPGTTVADIPPAIITAPPAAPPATAPPADTTPTTSVPNTPDEAKAPPIEHVWLVVLRDQRSDQAFGDQSTSATLKNLAAKGQVLPNYYAVAHGSLANGIAMISGQGPNPQTQDDCPVFRDVSPGDVQDLDQAKGEGCVYSQQTYTLPDQLVAGGRTWKAYIEDQGAGTATGAPATCRHPELDQTDPWHTPRPDDPYVTWRNPFVYFHTIIDSPDDCAKTVVGLDRLATDLKKKDDTPSFSYIVPSVCHDGSADPCRDGAPAGPAAADAWLQQTVDGILASPAYKAGGAIIITADQAPAKGPGADSSTCCDTPKPYPNTANPGGADTPGDGGGKVGALILSKYVKTGTVVDAERNHFSLLKGIEDVFGLRYLGLAGADGVKGFGTTVWTNWKP